MIKNKFTKGSEWRIWDLHIHTPNSICQNYGNTPENWEKFISALENLPNDVKVIGITDYYFIDGYEKVMEYKLKHNRLKNIEKIFPILEFRIDTFGSGNENKLQKINLHILFDLDESNLSQEIKLVNEEFISKINISSLDEHKTKSLSKENFISIAGSLKEGFNSLIPSTRQVFEFLNSITWKERTFLFLGYKEWSNLEKNQQLKLIKDNLYSQVGAFFSNNFTTNPSNQSWLDEFGNKKLLHSLDIHEFKYLDTFEFEPDGTQKPSKNYQCNTWIKADPTFEGLKQIKYEPNERVKIQNTNPSFDFDKPYFSSFRFNNDEQIFTDDDDLIFDKSSAIIPLNPNLITIIGGRGEGKSMLTEYIATSFFDKETNKEGVFSKNGNIEVDYCKTIRNQSESLTFPINEDKHSVDFIYINQGNLKNQVEDREKKSKLANSISNLAKLKKSIFNEELNQKVLDNIDELHKLKEFLNENENKIEHLESQEKSTNEFINNITTKENKDKLEKYSKNLIELNTLKLKKVQLENFTKQLNENITSLNEKIVSLNEETKNIPEIEPSSKTFKNQVVAIDLWLKNVNKEIAKIEIEITKVKDEFEKYYKGDLTTLLKDVDKFQNSLFDIRKKIKETKAKQERLTKLTIELFTDNKESKSLISKIEEEYTIQKNKILSDWETFTKVDERKDLNIQQKEIMKNLLNDLDIEVIVDFDEQKFYNEIYHCINGSEWRVKNNKAAQVKHFGIENLSTFFEYIKNKYLQDFYSTGFYKETFTNVLFDENKRKQYIKVFPILKYQKKDLNKISVGQKGTVYLKMMLATEAFSKPIIFDQPEDDLDNEFIMSNLIDLFKNLKKYRQVIIVTHNANLVINADAEQIIIAQNNKGKLKYISGSLENEKINNKICEILEGGHLAFEKRREKYKFIK
ncbi:hypothetical protein SAMN06265371_106215 [Lutibacter agarilyticus]|uniref:Uncharacterized protein n=1 Tax=Lutibacter agarilyticus TaxID=1109740 RepID=A0A238XQX6_9FLAO|nr:hypothetical protein [Lutibacter agarilyticus]SNR60744.1 hypothetical protein SAMN06265371_106215 [Lutibacter agarilyticus]